MRFSVTLGIGTQPSRGFAGALLDVCGGGARMEGGEWRARPWDVYGNYFEAYGTSNISPLYGVGTTVSGVFLALAYARRLLQFCFPPTPVCNRTPLGALQEGRRVMAWA